MTKAWRWMSSLAASRADGYYHPPEWDPQKVARDKYQGSKGSNQWEQYGVIRFEMPYNIWCGGCGKHIRKGTRFNAKKKDAGKYFSTKIFAFHMKCACCPQQIVIQTDPKNSDYVVTSGGRRRRKVWMLYSFRPPSSQPSRCAGRSLTSVRF